MGTMPVRAVGEQAKVSRRATSAPELTHVGLQDPAGAGFPTRLRYQALIPTFPSRICIRRS
jgi:hypothetical protein